MSLNQELQRYEELKKRIKRSTPVPTNETAGSKQKRIDELLGSFDKFCKYYFPIFFDPDNGGAEFGWFHKKAAKEIIADPNVFAVLEWPREHAKSVFADIFLPLYLKAKGEVTGMVIASANRHKASGLLSDIQAQFESNQRYINDFGEQYNFGNWSEGHFVTRDGIGFWAIGKGESPRGLREEEKRPNFLVIDDLDDDEEVRNPDRVEKSLDWLRGALIGAMALLQSRILMVGNRISKNSILSNIVGDVNEDDIKNPDIFHLKVFALENPKTHAEDQSETGVPAWKERYDRKTLQKRFAKVGYRMTQREYFHRQVEQGKVFKNEWLIFSKCPKISDFDAIVTYNDPSFKDSKKNDYKAIVCVGKLGNRWWLIDCWVRQATRNAMVVAHYDMHERIEKEKPKILKHFIEANFIQDIIIADYVTESENRKYMLAINEDKRDKPNKQGRIESMSVYFERSLVTINDKLKETFDWQNFKDQLIGFPNAHDDAPDAFEGAMFKLRELSQKSAPATMGQSRRSTKF